MSTERSKSEINIVSEIEWTPENEIKLFYALRGHKPVGIGKHFHMIAILEELSKNTEKEISSKTVWNRLSKLYDMETLDDNEDLPFPNHTIPFTIEGNKDFDELIAKKIGNDSNKDKDSDKEDIEVPVITPKAGTKGKTQDSNKTKVKNETEKSSKSDRKEESVKHLDKSDENEDQSKRSKKPLPKSSTELRSASHNMSSGKKRK